MVRGIAWRRIARRGRGIGGLRIAQAALGSYISGMKSTKTAEEQYTKLQVFRQACYEE